MDIVECANPKCGRMFRDIPGTCGICPSCGYDNNGTEERGA